MTTPHFHSLTITDIRRETPDAVSIAFDVPPDLRPLYAFAPGQYLTLRTMLDGEECRRSYSICAGLDDGEWRVAVKQVEGGRFSTYANTRLSVGDRLDVMTPMGRFTAALDSSNARTYLAVAAGSGITPILSLIRSVMLREPLSRFVLIYGNRDAASILFRSTLEDLKDRFLGRLSIHHVLTRESQDIAILNGRLTPERIVALARLSLPDARAIDDAFLCGPHAVTEAARLALATLGVPNERVHTEVFTTDAAQQSRKPVLPPRDAIEQNGLSSWQVFAVLDGTRQSFNLRSGETLIEGATRAGIELPYSCKGGMCCTCRAKLVEGEVEMLQNWSLEPWEIAAGFVLTCQCIAKTPTVTVDFDHA
jgi:ring-1,2-phenylacetyl-CoA epoxidase subunit PaaE